MPFDGSLAFLPFFDFINFSRRSPAIHTLVRFFAGNILQVGKNRSLSPTFILL
jgi:hypothetical protein